MAVHPQCKPGIRGQLADHVRNGGFSRLDSRRAVRQASLHASGGVEYKRNAA